MIRFILFALALLPICSSAQTKLASTYNWNTIPVTHPSDTIKASAGVVITLERRIEEVFVNPEQYFEEISIFHRKIKVETHDAVDNYNKIYISLNNVIEIVKVEARFIAPDGKITELPKESIRQIDNLEDQGNYQTFAIEGAQVGGEVEYFYILRKKFDANGGIFIQSDEPKANVYVQLSYPQELEYLTKSYNGFAPFITSTDTITKYTSSIADMGYIPSLSEEQYAFYKANLMRYEFTLAYNRYNSSHRVYNWAKVANTIQTNIYELNKSEQKAVRKMLKTVDNPSLPLEKRIRYIENQVKTSVAITKDGSMDIPLDMMIKYKQFDKVGVARLMTGLYRAAGIDFRLGITSLRQERPFDPDFNSWNYLDEYFLYFPQSNSVIVPYDENFRLGIAPDDFQDIYALVFKPVQVDKKTTILGYDIIKLPYTNCNVNADSMSIQIEVNTDDLSLHVNENRIFGGSNACNLQAFWMLVPDDKHNEMINTIFNMGSDDAVINKYDVKNGSPADMGNSSMVWQVDMTVKSLVEVAGNNLIVKIGETIGEQSQLYNNKKRTQPIQIDQLRSYFRRIELTIPDGYTIADPQNLNMDVRMMYNEKISCQFTSTYTLEGNKLVIISHEYYSQPNYPKENFEDYRQVINAAADFNKKTVLLVKK